MESKQLDLFSNSEIVSSSSNRLETLRVDANSFLEWKQKIFHYQQTVREQKPVQQVTLFDTHATHVDPDSIDPFSLSLQSLSFWGLSADSTREARLYFIIDNA